LRPFPQTLLHCDTARIPGDIAIGRLDFHRGATLAGARFAPLRKIFYASDLDDGRWILQFAPNARFRAFVPDKGITRACKIFKTS